MTKYLIALLVALSGALAAFYYRGEATIANTRAEAAEARVAAAKYTLGLTEAALKQHRAATLALQKKAKAQDAALKEALARSPEWAAQPVPPDVLDALRVR